LTLRQFPRVLVCLALSVVIAHGLTVVYLSKTSYGPILGNSLQIFSSFLAAAMCFRASQRRPGFSRAFWALVGCGMAMWGIADFGWAYYELAWRMEPPAGSLIRFLFDTHGMFFVMALFLSQDKQNSDIEISELLDFLQIGILFFLIYFGGYYLPAMNLTPSEALSREYGVMALETLGMLLLALAQWFRSSRPQVRRLFGGLVVYVLLYGSFSVLVAHLQPGGESLTGSWTDLAWSIPLLCGALWAATWQPVAEGEPEASFQNRTFGAILMNNLMFFVAPMIILIQVAQMGPGQQFIRFTLLGLSFGCYALRIGLTQFRQQQDEETVHRQTLAMDSSIEGIGILNDKGVHVYANAAMASMLGYSSTSEIIGQHWTDTYGLQEINTLSGQVRNGLQKEGKWSGSLSLNRPDGSYIPVEMQIGIMPDGGTVCMCRDRSEQRQSEKARAEAEAKYRMLVEQVNAITYIAEIGIDGKWYYVSPQVESILGYTPEEWLNIATQWAEHIHPDDLPAVAAAEEQSKQGLPFQAEFRVRRKDGRDIWISDTAVIVRGSNSHPVMEGIMVDITERKQLETQLQQSRKMEAVGRLAGGIAHDFNNLLTIITGYTELALHRPQLPVEVRGDIERIENASARAAALVKQLLAFSRKQVLQPKILDLNKIVLNLDALLRRLMDERIQMITRVKEDLGKVKADPAQIEQVIMNLVVNARDAMPEGGRLVVETCNAELDASYVMEHVGAKPGRYVMLAVSDNGVGMDKDTIAHIFEPFFTTKESGRGTGLGLSTVYGIVKQSGGYVWVYSEPGKGSTFKVYLPRVDDQPEDEATMRGALDKLPVKETILVVEDEEAVRELIQTVLCEKGYEVVTAHDPQQAEEVSARFPRDIQLLLTDMVMPGISGRELATRISARRRDIRVLYMSGYTDNVITSGGMLEKGLAFLQKPFSPATLVQKVREVLSHTPAT
jgi:PAS domain S-box-containing protein